MKKTPLHQVHVDHGAKMVDFGGWHLPVLYSSITKEHQAVRTQAGLFDVSHMGEATVVGADAEAFLNRVLTNNVARLVDGQALYTVMCKPDGNIVDDLIVYRRSADSYFLVLNASNVEKDFAWLQAQQQSEKVELKNCSEEYCQIALQGPASEKIMDRICSDNVSELGYFRFLEVDLLGKSTILARTGYTGEDGFELYVPSEHGPKVWAALFEAGSEDGLVPCGLGARDTLRLEASLALYGNDIDDTTNPLQAGLGWVVKWKKGDFIGRESLEKVKTQGPAQKLMGIRLHERIIPRQGYEVVAVDSEQGIGTITSGTLSPTLDYPIAMAYIDSHCPIGTKVRVRVRNKLYPGEIVPIPFYRRKKEQ